MEFAFREIFDAAPDALIIVDAQGTIVAVSARARDLFGEDVDAVVGRPIEVLVPDGHHPAHRERRDEFLAVPEARRMGSHPRMTARRLDGTEIPVEVALSPLETAAGRFVMCAVRDVSDRLQLEARTELSARLLDAVDAAVIATDMEGIVRYWSGGSERLSGWTSDEVVGRPITAFSRDPKTTEVMAHIQESGSWEGMLPISRKQGPAVPGFVRGILWFDEDERPAGMIAAAVDMAERLAIEEDLRAARDFLSAITENIGEGLVVIDDSGRITFANQAATGMLAVDQRDLLQTSIAAVLGAELETTGEILSALQPADGVARVDTLQATRADGSRLAVDITSSPMHQPGARQWALVMADDTERRARINGLERELDEIGWIGRITDALNNNALVLLGQPIVRIDSGATSHHELLVRLRSGDGSLISPGQFLPAAERHGLITDIDRWVVDRALEIAAEGHRVAINLSAATLADSDAPSCIAERIGRADADPTDLMFEITETAVLGDLHAGQNLVRNLADLGCQVALDDFGTGYGGFTYLKYLPVSVLKIDAEFVRDLSENPASQHVIQAIVGLATSFGLETVAEGVEDEATLGILGRLGVDLAQGYFIGRPEPLKAA
ncbi:MAG: hypothetical protein QOF12_1749 [Solirubrobacteraceae bacterium]|nr:hypothetical protein [Solirubrobacteraceae bacterium]